MALGFFDGVHIAHRDLLEEGRRIADKMGIPLGVFTFPSENRLKVGAKRLYSTEERLRLLEQAGIDFTVLVDFSAVSSLSPEDFVKEVLVKRLKCRVAVIGFNFRFGRGASGNAEILCNLMKECDGECSVREELKIDGETVCTTLIRELLADGNIEKANTLLKAPYRISGKIESGNGVGKGLGFPTINTGLNDWRVELRRGVYRTAVKIDGKIYPSITNVGTCPTFGERGVHLETYILNFDKNVYGKDTETFFLEFIRDEMQFKSEKELKMQINIDINTVIQKNGDKKWQELGQN